MTDFPDIVLRKSPRSDECLAIVQFRGETVALLTDIHELASYRLFWMAMLLRERRLLPRLSERKWRGILEQNAMIY